jgi:hypothetical protein
MRIEFIIRFSLLFLAAFLFYGCRFELYIPPPLPNPSDHSFPVTGAVRETGNVASVIERRGLFSRARAAPQANILLAGMINRPFMAVETTFPRVIRLRYQDDDMNWILPSIRRQYRWNGTITIEGHSVNTIVAFDVHATRHGYDKRFILRNAHLGQVRLQADDPLEVFNSATGSFPFLVGIVYLANHRYRIIAVLDNVLYDRSRMFKDIFFDPAQKFQFLDNQNYVVAELQMGNYAIYDTLPQANMDGMKQAIALFTAYRHAITVLRNIEGAWEPPSVHRFVYP